MRASRVAVLSLAGLAMMGLSACSAVRTFAGAQRVTPDEFRVVAIAPLTIPPDYALRPPTPGEPRPQELDPTSSAREILLGVRDGVTRSPAEEALAAAAGAEQADPLARFVVDDEFGDLAHKDESWAQRLMFWRSDDPASQAASTTAANLVIDAAREQERLAALTGGQAVVIQRADHGFKLPGL